jgi:hypothetical protein
MKYAEFTEEQKEKRRAACRRWRAANPGKQQESTRKWERKNPGRIKAANTAYRLANPGKTSEWGKNWRKRNPDYSIKRIGVTLSQFIALAVNQDGKCAICETKTQLCVDHNHSSSKIRGLLCRKCNAGLGLFKDSATNLTRAAAYIREELTCSE